MFLNKKIGNYLFYFFIFIIINYQHAIANNGVKNSNIIANEYSGEQAIIAKRVIMTELAYSRSKSLNEKRQDCTPGFFCGLTIIDLAMGSLGTNKNAAATEALIDLIVTTVDAGASEDLDCAIIFHGYEILPLLEKFNINDRIERCKMDFFELKRRELRQVSDITVSDVCNTRVLNLKGINDRVSGLMHAIRTGAVCE
ncbi:TPA: Imm57 family immunity protein [Escherichia coli]